MRTSATNVKRDHQDSIQQIISFIVTYKNLSVLAYCRMFFIIEYSNSRKSVICQEKIALL